MSDRAHTVAPPAPDRPAAEEELLHAYHDGELRGLARWRFERRLRRDAGLRRELAALAGLRKLLREHHAETSPDLWGAVALRLPAVDARRAGARRRPALAWWALPGAVAATAALALAILGVWPGATPAASGGVVRWVDGGPRSVMVLEGDPDTTIIWVLDAPAEGGGSGERSEAA